MKKEGWVSGFMRNPTILRDSQREIMAAVVPTPTIITVRLDVMGESVCWVTVPKDAPNPTDFFRDESFKVGFQPDDE